MNHRHPTSVTHVKSFKADSSRRDLSINSLGLTSNGEIIDYNNGLEDLKNKIIRAVGNPRERFTEDALRILRVFRFASKYGFDIEDKTKEAAKELSHLVDGLSMERISDELMKISSNGNQLAKYIEYLDDVGLLERILPEVKTMQGYLQNPEHHPEGDVYQHVISALKHSRSSNPITNLAILFHDISKPITYKNDPVKGHTYHGHDKESAEIIENLGRRLKFPKATIETIKFAADNHMSVHNIENMSKKKITQLVNNPNWPVLKDVVYADEMSRGAIGKTGVEAFQRKMETAEAIAAEISQGQGEAGIKKRISDKVNGYMVMDITGLPPGPEMGQILKGTQDWLYNNLDASEKEIKDYVMSVYSQMKSKTPPSLEEMYSKMLNPPVHLVK